MLQCLCRFVLALTTAGAVAQISPKPADAKPDYSKEAVVDEEDLAKIVFENDGTGTRETSLRLRIQSDAGVQRYSVLSFPYQEATETVEVVYVRVRKPDGTVIVTPAENVLDMPSEITRQAPFYSDLHEKHVAVKGLTVGDVLESQARWHVTKPLAPGQFWFAFNILRDFIVLHQELQVSVPRDRVVKWKSPASKPVITEEAGHRIFTWTFSQLQHQSADQDKADQEEKAYQAARGKLPAPDIQLSSFQSWEEVGAWYGGLQQERVKPSLEIRAKAAELTKNATDDNAKLHAIYNYVSTQFRYIGVAFGIGRYQPHSAADVLANQYGDCKDKHTLLASLLDAAGIKAYPALINSSRDLDPDVPSPQQFDHVITAVPQGKDFLWLDTTAEVAPFGYLVGVLRDKRALVITPDKPAALIATAADPPSRGLQTFKLDAKLSETGILEGKVDRTLSGDDGEILFRAAFRRMPMPQWKDLVQQVSYGSGFSGDVSEVIVDPPEKLDTAFHWTHLYSRKDFPDWPNHKVDSPLPLIPLPHPDTKPSYPVWLGSPEEIHYEASVELPKGYEVQLPAPVDLQENFAEYHAAYAIKNNVIKSDRKLVTKVREIPLADYDIYDKFVKKVEADNAAFSIVFSESAPEQSYKTAMTSLPDSENAEAAKAFQDAQEQRSSVTSVTESLKRAVSLDPKFTRAWLALSQMYSMTQDNDSAREALRKAIQADPRQLVLYKILGTALMNTQKYEEAVSLWRDLLKSAPEDVPGFSDLGGALAKLKRYDEASAALESAIKLDPQADYLYLQLGSVYARAGNEAKAILAFRRLLELNSSAEMLNDVGYELADDKLQLPLALEYAEKAVREEEEASAKVKLSDLKTKDLRYTSSLAAYWDTLGWVHFRVGNLERAEEYLKSAWTLSQGPTEADHLGQVYEQQHKKDQAVRMYRLALAASKRPDGLKETQERLDRLGGATKAGRFGENGTAELTETRTFVVDRITKETSNAEYFLLIGSGSKVVEVRFISGSDELKSADKALSSIDVKFPFPDDGPSRLVRRGILSCYPVTGCSFVLYNIYDVHSVN